MVELGLELWLADFGVDVDVRTWRFSEDEVRDKAEVQVSHARNTTTNLDKLSCFDFAAS